MLKDKILAYLEKIEQRQLSVGLNTLTLAEQEAFLRELQSYSPELLGQMREALFASPAHVAVEPLSSYDTATLEKRGEVGACGCLLLCGGQGSRLGSSDPKALFSISRIRKKTLLQIFCEKTAAASAKLGKQLPIAIMTSPLNHEKIAAYLSANSYFGLQIDLFSQQMLPFLDDRGNWLLEAPGKIAKGPDGNGHALKLFCQAGFSEKWQKQGIRSVNIVPIDNPLADPFDAELVSTHEQLGADVTIKAIFRHDPTEKVGVVGTKNHKTVILEYTDLPPDSSPYTVANTGLFCMSLAFTEKTAALTLPWHLAHKSAPVLLGTSKGYCQETAKIWKFETFIFDLLEFAEKSHVMVYPRDDVYSPVKNATGEKSPETVRSALFHQDRKILEKLTGASLPEKPFELDAAFHYPSPELCSSWKGKNLPIEEYIDGKAELG